MLVASRNFTADRVVQRCNSELAAQALRSGSGLAFHRPTQVYLQLASACNLSCYMCSEHNRPADARHGKGLISLSPEIFERLEHEVFPWSSQAFFGVGGEPTFSEHFVDFSRRADLAGQEVHLVTNGTFFDRVAVVEAVARHVDFVQVSIDAATPATYERIRIGSRWKRLMAGLEALAALRRGGPDGGGCHLSLCFVLMRSNVHELPAFVELAQKLGANTVRAQHVIAMTQESVGESLVDEPRRYDEMHAQALLRARALGIELLAPDPFGAEPPAAPTGDPELAGHAVPCRSPYQSVVILYDGRVFGCCHPLAHQRMELGNLNQQSFEEIWNGRLWRNLRAGMKTGDVPQLCRSCSIVHSPPPIAEVAGELETSAGIADHYAERDLDPLPPGVRLDDLARAGVSEYAQDLRRHADALERERDAWREHARTLERERAQLLLHAATLERERPQLIAHIANLESERPQLVAHIATLERERPQLVAHIATLERERPHLLAHIENLETKLSRWRAYLAWPQRLGFGAVAKVLWRSEQPRSHTPIRHAQEKLT